MLRSIIQAAVGVCTQTQVWTLGFTLFHSHWSIFYSSNGPSFFLCSLFCFGRIVYHSISAIQIYCSLSEQVFPCVSKKFDDFIEKKEHSCLVPRHKLFKIKSKCIVKLSADLFIVNAMNYICGCFAWRPFWTWAELIQCMSKCHPFISIV